MVFTVSSVFAAPPLSIHIVVEEIIGGGGGAEPFAASGPAVDVSLVCQAGTVLDLGGMVTNNPNSPYKGT